MKYIVIISLLVVSLFSKSVEVSIVSNDFKADETKKESVFLGSVKIKKESDEITADRVIVKFDDKNKPISYKAVGNVKFNISMKKSSMKGSCKELEYSPLRKIYTLRGGVDIVEYPSKRKLNANYVTIDTVHKRTVVSGDRKKPVKFIFNIEEE